VGTPPSGPDRIIQMFLPPNCLSPACLTPMEIPTRARLQDVSHLGEEHVHIGRGGQDAQLETVEVEK
jgi:hypothetical protein